MPTDFSYSIPRVPTARALDLFSGAGGLSLGLLMAGGTPTAAIDFDVDSIKTFRRNFPNAPIVETLSIENWTPPRSLRSIDIVIGGPPCQGFSLARGTRFVDDPRNALYKHFVRIVGLLEPEIVVMENVEGITNIADGLVLRQILEDFELVGYSLQVKVINMADFGVPQTRRRAFFVGVRSATPPPWPTPSHSRDIHRLEHSQGILFGDKPVASPWLAVNPALSDLCLPLGNYFSHRANSKMRGPRNRIADEQPAFTLRVRGDEFGVCEEPATSAFVPAVRLPEPVGINTPVNAFQELMQARPSWAEPDPRSRRVRRTRRRITGTRFLTLREQARLQSFPDWFVFEGSRTSVSRQIGNAVPPLFAAELFRTLIS